MEISRKRTFGLNFALLIVLLPVVFVAFTGCEKNGTVDQRMDMTAKWELIQGLVGGSREGVIVTPTYEEGQETAVGVRNCSYEGQQSNVEIIFSAPDQMSCLWTETEKDTDCSFADRAQLPIELVITFSESEEMRRYGEITLSSSNKKTDVVTMLIGFESGDGLIDSFGFRAFAYADSSFVFPDFTWETRPHVDTDADDYYIEWCQFVQQ